MLAIIGNQALLKNKPSDNWIGVFNLISDVTLIDKAIISQNNSYHQQRKKAYIQNVHHKHLEKAVMCL